MLIIKILLDMLNRFTKVCNTLYIIYTKKENKKVQKRLDALKILENKDYIMKNVSSKTKLGTYSINTMYGIVVMLLSFFISKFLNESNNLLIGIFSIFVLLLSLSYAYNSIIVFLLSLFRYFRQILFSVLIFVNAFILGDILIGSISNQNIPNRIVNFFTNLFKEYNLQTEIGFDKYQFWFIFLVMVCALCLSLYLVLKSLDIFELESMEKENDLIVGLLTITTFVISADFNKVKLIGIFLFILIILTTFFTILKLHFLSKRYEEAQTIFQEQLLLKFPDYQELKNCYYSGGEKYREKLLSTEKFLEVIVKNEFKSLNDLKNYDDYKLYKATR
jgi:hypothetical protein